MLPPSIRAFALLYPVGTLIGLVIGLTVWPETKADMLAANPEMASIGEDAFASLILLILLGSLTVSTLLWYFVAWRRSNIARWIVILSFAVGLLGLVASNHASNAFGVGVKAGLLLVLSWLLHAAAVWMLVRPDARDWFSGDARRRELSNRFR